MSKYFLIMSNFYTSSYPGFSNTIPKLAHTPLLATLCDDESCYLFPRLQCFA